MENQRKDAVGLQPTEPDLLYQKPANYARRKPMEQTKQEQFILPWFHDSFTSPKKYFSFSQKTVPIYTPFFSY